MKNEAGWVDLGKKYPKLEDISMASNKDGKQEKVHYPSMYIEHDTKEGNSLDELPDGEFEFTGKGRVIKYTEDLKNGKCSCEIEVMGIKPSTTKQKKPKSSEESLDEALTEVANKKSNYKK